MPRTVAKLGIGLVLSATIGCGSRANQSGAATASATAVPSTAAIDAKSASTRNALRTVSAPVGIPTGGTAGGAVRMETNHSTAGIAPTRPNDLASALVGNPFAGAARFDAQEISGPGAALVSVVREIDGRAAELHPGYVFAGD